MTDHTVDKAARVIAALETVRQIRAEEE